MADGTKGGFNRVRCPQIAHAHLGHGFALGLLITLLLARLLGPLGYGVYAFVLAVVSLISLPVQLGLSPLIVRHTPGKAHPR